MYSGNEIASYVPALRRYARALMGSQPDGDGLVERTLRAMVQSWDAPAGISRRVALYRALDRCWREENIADPDRASRGDVAGEVPAARLLSARLGTLSWDARRVLLLTAMEDFNVEETAMIVDREADAVTRDLDDGLAEIEAQTQADVLIIEDEPIIAMDIEATVEDLGHRVVGIASTRDTAVAAARREHPTLVLADIQLADNSSGVDAVVDILADFHVPVVFITAFPERLLTGVRPEPTFLLAKPFQRRALQVTIAQALLFDPGTVPASA